MKKLLMAMAFAAVSIPVASQASQSNGISYNYVQLDYANISQSGHDFVADGGILSGSYSFADHYQVFGSYSDLRSSTDRYPLGIDNYTYTTKNTDKPWTLGVGYFTALSDRADWVTQLSYTRDRYTNRVCVDDYGCYRFHNRFNTWSVNTGVMGHITDKLIGNAYIGYSNGGKGVMGNVFGDFGLMYAFNTNWAIEGGVRLDNNSTETFTLGVRASF